MVIPTIHIRSEYSEIPLRIAKGHFATSHSHINYFVDMTFTKHRLAEARQAARELAVKFRSSEISEIVDTILCLDGTEVLGACLAEELVEEGITATVDLESLTAGSYELPLIISEEEYPGITFELETPTVSVTLTDEGAGD